MSSPITPPRTQRLTSTSSSSTQGGWRARVCHIQGFAPFCKQGGYEFGKQECPDEQQRINATMGDAVSFETLAAES